MIHLKTHFERLYLQLSCCYAEMYLSVLGFILCTKAVALQDNCFYATGTQQRTQSSKLNSQYKWIRFGQ
jgi:hypothetical protein